MKLVSGCLGGGHGAAGVADGAAGVSTGAFLGWDGEGAGDEEGCQGEELFLVRVDFVVPVGGCTLNCILRGVRDQ